MPIVTTVVFGLLAGFVVWPTETQAVVPVRVVGGPGTQREATLVRLNQEMLNLIRRLENKEYVLDPAANAARAAAASAYRQTVVDFTASGNNGSPYFIQNVELFRAGLRTNTYNDVYESLNNSGMCDAFEEEVIVELKRIYIEKNAQSVAQKNTCILDEVTENDTEAFLDGHVTAESAVQGFWSVAQSPNQTTPRGVSLTNERRAKEQADEAEENALLEANWGQGFYSQYESGQSVIICTQGEVNGIRNNCRVATPSTIMRERAAGALRIEEFMVTSGDEHQEQPEADLARQMAQSTLSGGYTGRAGGTVPPPTTPPPSGGGGGNGGGNDITNPFPSVPRDAQNPTTQSFLVQVTTSLNQTNASSTNPVRPLLIRTLSKLHYLLQTVTVVTDLETKHASTTDKYEPYDCFDVSFPLSVINQRTLSINETPPTIDGIKQLYALFLRYEEATANNQSTAQILADLQEVLSLNIAGIPTEADLAAVIEEYDDFRANIVAPYNTEYNQAVVACELIVNPPENNNSDNSGGGG